MLDTNKNKHNSSEYKIMHKILKLKVKHLKLLKSEIKYKKNTKYARNYIIYINISIIHKKCKNKKCLNLFLHN